MQNKLELYLATLTKLQAGKARKTLAPLTSELERLASSGYMPTEPTWDKYKCSNGSYSYTLPKTAYLYMCFITNTTPKATYKETCLQACNSVLAEHYKTTFQLSEVKLRYEGDKMLLNCLQNRRYDYEKLATSDNKVALVDKIAKETSNTARIALLTALLETN